MKLWMDQHVATPGPTSRPLGRRMQKPDRAQKVLPTNLRDWFSDATLAWWIQQEVKKLKEEQPEPSLYLHGHSDSDRGTMLSILALAFADQLFESDDIARACRSEPVFRRLCQGRPPFSHEVSRFRRQNRPALEQILSGLFTQAVLLKFGLDPERLPMELQEDLHDHAAERLDLARHMDTGQNWWGLES